MSQPKTNEDVIAAIQKYPEANVKSKEFTSRVIGVDRECGSLVLRATGGVITDAYVCDAKDCTLQLHKLDKITDEHKVALAELLEHSATAENIEISHCNTFCFTYLNSQSFIELKYLPFNAADYLRSKSYDVDGYIENGIAEEII